MRERKAKIVATLGPASSAPETIRALFDAGADVFRLNFSHGTHDDHRAVHAAIRDVETSVGRPIGILTDMQGPKLRIGAFEEGAVELQEGAKFHLDLDETAGNQAERHCRIPRSSPPSYPGWSCCSTTAASV